LGRTQREIRSLFREAPKTATVIENGQEHELPVASRTLRSCIAGLALDLVPRPAESPCSRRPESGCPVARSSDARAGIRPGQWRNHPASQDSGPVPSATASTDSAADPAIHRAGARCNPPAIDRPRADCRWGNSVRARRRDVRHWNPRHRRRNRESR
jgi:hypothetical protein